MVNKEQLKDARAQIDQIDDLLLELLNRRAALAQQVAVGKKAELGDMADGAEIIYYRPDREAQVLGRVCEQNPGPFPDSAIRTIYREVISATLALEQPLKVAYVEQSGGFASAAAVKHFGRSAVHELVDNDRSALQRVVDGSADVAMVAIGDRPGGLLSQPFSEVVTAGVVPIGELWSDGRWQFDPQIDPQIDQKNVSTDSSRSTRLLVLGRQRCEPTGADRTLMVVETESEHQGRSLQAMLGPDAEVVALGDSGQCCLMVEGHLQDRQVIQWIDLLNGHCRSVKVLSSWPAALDDTSDG